MISKVCSLSLLALVVAAVGCQKGNPNAPSSVSGEVTYKGEKLQGGTVNFHSKEKGVFQAPINVDGTFRAVDIPSADYAVTVETESVSPEREKAAADYKGGYGGLPGRPSKKQPSKKAAPLSPPPEGANTVAGKYRKIPARYADPAKSKLTAKITAGKNDGLKFELTD